MDIMKNTKELTTISISREMHALLLERGKKGETFDEILKQVLKQDAVEGRQDLTPATKAKVSAK